MAQSALARRAFIAGGAHTSFIGKGHPDFVWKGHPDFGKRDNPTFEDDLKEAVNGCLDDTGVDPATIDRLYLGNFVGELAIDAGTHRLTKFKAWATGKAWGEGTYTPKPLEGKFPLQVAFTLAYAGKQGEKMPARIVSPQGLDDGRDTYLSPPDSDE